MKIRRVIVGLDISRRDRVVLEAAARLAERLQAELVGLFVENIDVLHFAGLPFAQEVGFASVTRRGMDLEGMERSMRALAAETERMLAAVAGRVPVRWSFQVVRGSIALELLATATDADLVVANIDLREGPAGAIPVRIVRAGDPVALRAALEQEDGILVLAGANDAIVGETLRRLMAESQT